MAISPEQFKKILARTSELCQEEAKTMSSSQVNESNYNMLNSQPELDYTSPYDLDESYDGVPYSPEPYDAPISTSAARNSKLPDAIKQSMLQETIDVSSANPNRSVLDDILKDVPARKPAQRAINENRVQAAPQSPAIDYSLIKMIVEEAVEKKLEERSKQQINESALKTIELSGGKIRLIDNKGNLFTASLKHQGNINDKK